MTTSCAGAGTGGRSEEGAFNYNLRFPGQYYMDEVWGLYYNMARVYDPDTGRYQQSDQIGLAGGVNTYAYVTNNPISYVDPNGKNPLQGAIWGSNIGTAVGTVGGPAGAVAGRVIGGVIGAGIGYGIWQLTRDNPGEGDAGKSCPKPCKLVEEVVLGDVKPIDGRPQSSRVCIYQCEDGSMFSKEYTNSLGCAATATQNPNKDPGINPDSGPRHP